MLPRIQILRAIAAIGVLLLHGGYLLAGTPLLPVAVGIWHIGYAGVDIFFTISGFILAHTLRPGTTRRRFLASRILRVYSGYWPALAFCFLLFWLSGRHLGKYSWAEAASLWPMDIRHAPIPLIWTLYHELFFYLLFALLMRLSVRRRNLILAAYAGAIVLVQTVFWMRGYYTPEGWPALPTNHNQFLLLALSPYLLEFICGVWLQAWLGGKPAFDTKKAARTCLVLGMLGFGLAAIADAHYVPSLIAGQFNWQRVLWMMPPAMLLVAWASMRDVAGVPARGTRWLLPIGNASYGLFLIQLPMLKTIDILAAPLTGRPWAMVGVFVLATTGIAVFSLAWLRFIEKPLAGASNRLVDRVFPLLSTRQG